MGNAEHFQAFYVDISQKNATEMIQAELERRGLVTFDKVHSVEELRLFCSKLGKTLMHRDSDEYGVTRIINREMMLPEDGYHAFTNAALTLHTDGSSVAEPATLVVFWCAYPGETGGLSLFVDGKSIYQFLAAHHPSILQTLAKPRSAIFAGAETPLESAIFSKLPDGSI
jgi:alpha-ketoglutarate-dependent taurine dioxygenase